MTIDRIRRAPAALAFLGVALASLLSAGHAKAADPKKAIWGPVLTSAGASEFPTYNALGVGIYQYGISWATVAPTRPAQPTNPADPAYHWPAQLDFAISEARRYGMRVMVELTQTPPWANDGRSIYWAPTNPQDFADFATAAARRYPGVNLWQIWGEPGRTLLSNPRGPRATPRAYAKILDASYGALKAVNPVNLVISGSTITTDQINPLPFIKNLRLPNGQPPRMDLWGHNPFSPRKPNLAFRPKQPGTADISDLDTLMGWLDHKLGRSKHLPKLKVFISEWTIPTDYRGNEFTYWGSRRTVARYLSRALRITDHLRRVYTFGWYQLYDQPPNNWGLLTVNGDPKPAYYAFKNG